MLGRCVNSYRITNNKNRGLYYYCLVSIIALSLVIYIDIYNIYIYIYIYRNYIKLIMY